MNAARPPVRPWLIAVALGASTFAWFSPAVGFGFLDYDDPDFVTQNAHVLGGLTWSGVRWAFTSGGDAANWQPLTWLSLMLDAQWFGPNAAAFHLVNVLWHAANAVLAFLVLRELTGRGGASAWGAALFAWHPLRVESVAWVAERKDVLSVCGGLLTLWAYARYVRLRQAQTTTVLPSATGPKSHAWRWYAGALGAYVAGLLCKPMLVTLPLVLGAIEWALARRSPSGRRAPEVSWRTTCLRLAPFLLAALGCAAITLVIQHAGGAMSASDSAAHRIGNAFVAITQYLRTFAWPTGLAAGYPQQRPLPPGAVIVGFVVVAAAIITAARQRRQRPWFTAGVTWFLVMLLPVLGFIAVGPQSMADRYTYLPSLGLVLAAIAVIPAWDGTGRVPRWALAVAAVVSAGVAGVCTWRQLPVWRDSTTLFEHALAVTSRNDIAHAARATTLLNAGDLAGAEAHSTAALRINPRCAPAWTVQGALAEHAGRAADAEQSYRRAVAVAPRYAAPHARLAALLLHHGRPAEALAEFDGLQALRPESAAASLGAALAHIALGNDMAAEPCLQRALALNPRYAEALNAFGNLLVRRGDFAAAIRRYDTALEIRPTFAEAHFNLANTWAEQGRLDRALPHYRAAARLDPADPDYRRALAEAIRLVATR